MFFFFCSGPPGLNSHSDLGHGISDEHGESTRVNVINGEMVIIRNAVFEDVVNTTVSFHGVLVIAKIE